jgi:hypothetical protein
VAGGGQSFLWSFARLGPFQSGDNMSFIGQSPLLVCRELVIGVRGDGHRRGRAAKAVADAAVVFGTANEDSDCFVVVLAAEHVIDEGHVEVKFSQIMSSYA